MSYAEMKKRWPDGWTKDPAVMEIVRQHGRREHGMHRTDCPVCVRFWPPSAAKQHHANDVIASVLKKRGHDE